jgi:cysteinyl-tRNA synthetase
MGGYWTPSHHKSSKTRSPMSISIYNTLTNKKESFKPLFPQQVSMYCCGVTVYDLCHLGHARSYVVWDTVRRYLEWSGYEVKYIQNFTDIDDKILNRSRTENSSMEAVAEKYIAAYFADLERLKVRSATSYPRATEHIPQIIELIQTLETKGLAYAANGDVYYRVGQFPTYGKLSGRKLADMEAGASGRLESLTESAKEDPCDFALWKAAKEGEPAWDSPWGKGRPGWHIECSAMISAAFPGTIDIHCGGSDLIFPHHENEIAQSEGAKGHPLARYWMHNGMVRVDGEKMSKSLGNFTTIRDLLDRPVDPMVIRLLILTAQYRKPIDFTPASIATNETSWQTIKTGLTFGEKYGAQLGWFSSDSAPVQPVKNPPAPPANTVPATVEVQVTPTVIGPFQDLPNNARNFAQTNRGLLVLAATLFFTQFPIKFLASFLNTVNGLPLLPEFFKTVGLLVAVRTILWKGPRERFFEQLRRISAYFFPPNDPVQVGNDYVTRFRAIVDEDFNFAGGLAVLFDLSKSLNKQANILSHGGQIAVDSAVLRQQWQTLTLLAGILGLEAQLAEAAPTDHQDDTAEIEAAIGQRTAARQAKNWQEADRIRDLLQAQGIELIDGNAAKTTWRRITE